MDGALRLHRPPGVRPKPSLLAEAGVILQCLLVIGSVPALPGVLLWLLWRAWKAETHEQRRQARRRLGVLLAVYAFLMFVPVSRRPWLMGAANWRWFLEYFSVAVAYRGGVPLEPGQYMYLLIPHGLYPFSGACAAISKMRDVFPRMRIGVAPVALRLPVLRHLIHWIGCVGADQASLSAAVTAGDSVCLFPGGIGEMMRTDSECERIILRSRKGFVRTAASHGIPIVPVYVFGQSVLWSHLRLPEFVERFSRWLRLSIILPYGRFGSLVPRKRPLLYAVGNPIHCGPDIDATHTAVLEAVQDLYDFYRGLYGWQHRPLSIE
eukprot:TRINITY_DN42118_c0_g1_i1.p1 TRINITY_DN42118_c0_g1~~TRINITY_DN42118_c0_g1_i1.p1  ORF type:complete len:332 (-),score=34.48 TRINITY_DN42118_c0_g1_i1:28-993(-)